MVKKLLVNADHPEECRAVILEDGKVEDFIIEHATREQLKGNIYLGVINRVEPAIEAAFVDFGGKKFGFLPFKDVLRESYLQTGERKAKIRIQDVLARGQKILVQVVKEGRDHKGPSLTNSVSIPGRFLVLTFGGGASGISRKIEDESERKKLRDIVSDFQLPENMGLIIRTAGLGRTKLELQKDLQMLLKIWENLEESINSTEQEPPLLLYQEADMVQRTVRDHFTTDMDEIWVDNVKSHKILRQFIKMVMPRMQSRVKLYQDIRPIFSHFNVEEQIESIYNRSVPLHSGGSLVFDIGEAMVAIDVNSGKTTSSSELETTAVRTNMEAADEIARQLRLRDLGGLIVIDFIDMFQKKNKAQVEKQLKKAFKLDKARINLSRISKFGIMEMSRQRMSPPVGEGIFEKCPRCHGFGHVKTVGANTLSVARKIQEVVADGRVKELSVEVLPEVVSYFLNYKMDYLKDLQEKLALKIHFHAKPGITFEEFQYNVIEYRKEGELPPKPKGREFKVFSMPKPEEAPAAAPIADNKEEKTDEAPIAQAPRPKRDGRPHPGKRRYPRRSSQGRRSMQNRGRHNRPQRPGGQPQGNSPAPEGPVQDVSAPLPQNGYNAPQSERPEPGNEKESWSPRTGGGESKSQYAGYGSEPRRDQESSSHDEVKSRGDRSSAPVSLVFPPILDGSSPRVDPTGSSEE